jgi:DNA-binding GntR family transcriptional regulator
MGDPRRYVQVAAFLRDQIVADVLKAGQPMPSLAKVATICGVGPGSARRGMQILVDEGFVWLVHGLGYYVRRDLADRQEGRESGSPPRPAETAAR